MNTAANIYLIPYKLFKGALRKALKANASSGRSSIAVSAPALASNNISDEVQHHEKMSSDWWDDKRGPVYALHSMNAIRVPFIRDGLIATNKVDPTLINTTKVLYGLEILDVGCGGGILTEQLARLHAKVTGIDAGKELIDVASKHIKEVSPELESRTIYKKETVEDHVKNNCSKYDAVVLSEVLEHIDNKVSFLKSCVETLKPGGSIFLTTLNKTPATRIGSILMAENILKIVPKGTHNYEKLMSPEEVQKILKEYNCSTILINGCTFDFMRNKWLWIPSTTFSYALQAVKEK